MRIAESVRCLAPYVPGEQPVSPDAVKLNTNENPYTPSPRCAAVLASFDLERLRRYPDPRFSALRCAIAKRCRVAPERVFVGNGSDEVLSLAARAFVEDGESIASLDPSYSLYKTLAAIRDVAWAGLPAGLPGRAAAKRLAAALPPETSLFLWTNPNAPTGAFTEPETIAAFAKKFPGVVIIDEAYADFARANCLSLAAAPRNRNVIVMRTFSKAWALAGLRVGWCVGPKDLIDALYKVKDSYNVDAVAQAVALAAFGDRAWLRRTVAAVKRTRRRLSAELSARGWDVPPSESNFVFAKPPPPLVAAEVFAGLRERGVFVRYFPGPLTGDRLRITVGTEDQVSKLLSALDNISRTCASVRTRSKERRILAAPGRPAK